jgi:hypothetical protein
LNGCLTNRNTSDTEFPDLSRVILYDPYENRIRLRFSRQILFRFLLLVLEVTGVVFRSLLYGYAVLLSAPVREVHPGIVFRYGLDRFRPFTRPVSLSGKLPIRHDYSAPLAVA